MVLFEDLLMTPMSSRRELTIFPAYQCSSRFGRISSIHADDPMSSHKHHYNTTIQVACSAQVRQVRTAGGVID